MSKAPEKIETEKKLKHALKTITFLQFSVHECLMLTNDGIIIKSRCESKPWQQA